MMLSAAIVDATEEEEGCELLVLPTTERAVDEVKMRSLKVALSRSSLEQGTNVIFFSSFRCDILLSHDNVIILKTIIVFLWTLFSRFLGIEMVKCRDF